MADETKVRKLEEMLKEKVAMAAQHNTTADTLMR